VDQEGPPWTLPALLEGATSSALLNFITWNKAYSLFPRQTLIDQKTINLTQEDERPEAGADLRSLAKMGFTNGDILWPDLNMESPALPRRGQLRRIGDQQISLVIPVDVTSVSTPMVPDSAIEYSSFVLFQSSNYSVNLYFDIAHPPCLQYGLAVPPYHDSPTIANEWEGWLRYRLQRWTAVEVHKLSPLLRQQLIPEYANYSYSGGREGRLSMEPLPEAVSRVWNWADD
jgi:hypothetical protein